MGGTGNSGAGRHSWLVRLLIRGPDAEFVRIELDDAHRRDLERGVPPRRARRRHLRNVLGSAVSLWKIRLRGLWFSPSWLDVKLGLRMLLKHPGLTAVSVFALAIGIPVGMAPLHLSNAIEAPLPEDGANRVRGIRYYNPVTTGVASATAPDLELLREQATTFEAIGAFRSVAFNVASQDGRAAPVTTAEVTASIFDILGTPPLMGRTLEAADDAVGAPAVIVLGQDVWEARFAGDPDVVGSTVRVAGVPHTVVGVMPEGFLFPSAHQAWLPLRTGAGSSTGQTSSFQLIGRLADGVSDEEAQAELSTLALRARDEMPESRARLQVEVVPFGLLFMGIRRSGLEGMPEFYLVQVLALVLLLVACGNVAMLIFARSATRMRELAVRTALGASRSRIVSQLFIEALVLSIVAAGVGLFVIDWIIGRARVSMLVGEVALPYWLTLSVTPEAVGWAILLAALSAAVAGIVPALRVTGKKVQQSITRAEAGRSGVRFGGVTSALIVADVAVAVAVIAFAVGLTESLRELTGLEDELAGIPAEDYLAVELRKPVAEMQEDGTVDPAGFRQRLGATQHEVVERLEAEPGVRGVAVAQALPRQDNPSRRIEVEGTEAGSDVSGWQWIRTVLVDVGFFEGLEQTVVSGRFFSRADLDAEAAPAIVNTVFADRLLGGRDPIGRRLRVVGAGGEPIGPWHEIVGVVGNLGVNLLRPAGTAGVYVLAPPGGIYPVQLAVHAVDSPEALVPRIREIVMEVDPDAILGEPVVLSEVHQGDWYLMIAIAGGMALLVLILVVLAASAVYAIVSFSVAERTREIGIRTALGAGRPRLVVAVLRRSMAQIGLGAAVGVPLATWLLTKLRMEGGDAMSPLTALPVALALGTGVVCVVALFSCVAPTRRALRVDAGEALRSE